MPVLESVKSASEGWSFTTLEQHLVAVMLAQADQLKAIMDERDRTYQQRWESQERALQAALLAAKEAVNAALVAQEKAVFTAFAAAEKATADALRAQQEAVSKAEDSTNKRLESMNEFRAALSDAAGKSIPRVEFDRVVENLNQARDISINALSTRLEELKSYKDTTNGKVLAIGGSLAALLTIAAFGISLLSFLRNS